MTSIRDLHDRVTVRCTASTADLADGVCRILRIRVHDRPCRLPGDLTPVEVSYPG
jgi:hypothetical protein